MNTNDMLAILAELFDSFSFHELFLEELGSLLKKDLKGKENRFFKMLSTQLNHIRTFGRAIYTVDGHEILQGADGHYYSIHLQQSQFNVRLLVQISDDDTPYFLCAFNEKSGKRKTDYSAYTKVMQERLKDFGGVL